MGVGADFLPRVIAAAGRPLDLADFRDGVPLPESALAQDEQQQHHQQHQQHQRQHQHQHQHQRRRPLRIGIDVASWIYRAGFAFGDRLMVDERHLSAYGRASLHKEREQEQEREKNRQSPQLQQKQQQQNPNLNENQNLHHHHHHQQQQQQQREQKEKQRQQRQREQDEKIRNYCDACANYVVRRLRVLKQDSNAQLLVVFDGRTPPIKTATVTRRRRARQGYQDLRDGTSNATAANTTAANANATDANATDAKANATDANATDANANGTSSLASPATPTMQQTKKDIQQRVIANRRAGPGEHVPQIVRFIIHKLNKEREDAVHPMLNNPNNNNNNNPNNNNNNETPLASWMVAPYEADSQLAYLSKQCYIDLVVAEDTDLVAHGCRAVLYRCLEPTRICSKTWAGGCHIAKGELLEFQALGATRDVFLANHPPGSQQLDFTDFTPVMMAVLFVLLGCDYNGYRKLKGIGITTACRIVRKAFLERRMPRMGMGRNGGSSLNENKNNTNDPSKRDHPHGANNQHRHRHHHHKSCLAVVWEEAYAHSCEPSEVFTDEFKTNYQQSFVEALVMYRHPVVFDPLIQNCLLIPAPVPHAWGGEHAGTVAARLGDPELVEGCPEYARLLTDPNRLVRVVGELPPTPKDCMDIAQGISHERWRLKKPTPIYDNVRNSNDTNHGSKTPGTNKIAAATPARNQITPQSPPSSGGGSCSSSSSSKQERFSLARTHGSGSKRTGRESPINEQQQQLQLQQRLRSLPSSPPSSPVSKKRRNDARKSPGEIPRAFSPEPESPVSKKRRNDARKSPGKIPRAFSPEPESGLSDHQLQHQHESNNNARMGVRSDRRESLEGDEIAVIAAGGFRKEDPKPSLHGTEPQLSRTLFPPAADADAGAGAPNMEKKKALPASSLEEDREEEEDRTDDTEMDTDQASKNLLASTTPEPSSTSGGETLTLSSSKATTATMSLQTQSQSQSQSPSQSSRKAAATAATQNQATSSTSSSAEPASVDLLMQSSSSATRGSQSTPQGTTQAIPAAKGSPAPRAGLFTPTRARSQSQSQSRSPSQFSLQLQSPSQTQTQTPHSEIRFQTQQSPCQSYAIRTPLSSPGGKESRRTNY
eukprot:CAMPEP_0172377356 /NCGR_PEP_ID=MMETSP1060-20121228/68861_1 /TAXON_ID=37318 /ORGANISM="Pseudo-nitzschia pungens, Strain cf. cingulata" /LENGTH=1108 /DNA_ID=CAMNT_0013105039 /DNA_START=1131 /DNA_END=4457 /DNA_ORIENTATION=-